MSVAADIAIFDSGGRLVAVAEVKQKLGTSATWAAALRRNMAAHGGFTNAEFFLLATPDRLYLWRHVAAEPVAIEPTLEVDARPIFGPYFEKAGVDPERVSGAAFELMVANWLVDVLHGQEPRGSSAAAWLRESGFLDAVRSGRIEFQAAA